MDVPVVEMEPRHNGYSAALPLSESWLYALELWHETASSPWASIVLKFDNAGRLLAANYTAYNFFIVVKPGLKNGQDDKANPSCVQRIELMNRKNGG